MTEQEAIEVLKNNYPKMCKMVNGRYQGGFDNTESDFGQALTMAISVLKEIQQYREIGTVEECREAVEKQKPKAVTNGKLIKNFYGRPYCIKGDCPTCGRESIKSTDTDYCYVCGQHLKWDEDLEGMEDE